MKSNILSGLVILISLFFYAFYVQAQEKPEIFVQTGHTDSVKIVAINKSGTYLVTMEEGGRGMWYIKIWDTAIGREIRTLKLEPKDGGASNIYFIDDSRFIVFYQKSAEIFDLYGQKTESINLPKIGFVQNPVIGKDGQYLFNKIDSDGTKIYSMKDGSEISLPELRKYNYDERYHRAVADLGYAYYGIFHKGQSPKGNVDYVIYDDSLNIHMKGSLNIPGFPFGSTFKISSDLKYVARKSGGFISSDDIEVYNLLTGERLWSYKPRALAKKGAGHDEERLYFGFIPDGRLRVEYEKQNNTMSNFTKRMELVLINPVNNGIYTEKSIVFDGLIGFESSPYVITDKGMLIAGFANGNVKMTDINTGAEIKSFGVKPSVFIHSVCVGDQVLNYGGDFSTSASPKYINVRFNLWDLGAASLKKLNVTTETGLHEKPIKIGNINLTSWFSTDPDRLYSQIPVEFITEDFKKNDTYGRILSLPGLLKNNAGDFSTTEEQHKLVLMNRKTSKKLADLYAFEDGEWVVIAPEGYFNASPNGAKHLNVRVGNNVYSIDNFYEKFFNPVYVASVLQGKKVEAVADIRKGILTPPDVKIISPEPNTSFSTDTVTITISAKDTGGGIDEIRLYHNGKAIGEDTRAVKIVPKGNEAVKSYTVTLVDGANTFRATAFSKDRTESNPYELMVKLTAPSKEVNLYILAVGINKYKNPALNLNYAEPDARGIVNFFRQKGGLFKKVNVIEIYDEQATKETIISKLKELQNTNPQDAVLIYLAGHGESVSDKWYFIPHELTYPEREEYVKTKGISSDEFSGYIRNITAQKMLVLIDACKSGAVLVAFRGFEDRKALSQLSRSTGVHIVAASTKDQFAAEVKELGHGVFTYILLEGLKGKAAGKGETVTVRKLMGYIEEKLPEITKKYKQEAQYPVVDSKGMDFPLSLTK